MIAAQNEPVAESSGVQPTVEERRALIERVAGSPAIKRAPRLRDFLLYVGEESLKEDRPEIHEYEIGEKVFGRPNTYDRSQDNIVRVNATELRKRVEMYFASEGADEPLIFTIPRGIYRPVFQWRIPGHAVSQAVTEEERPAVVPTLAIEETTRPAKSFLGVHLIWGSLCLALLIACVVLLLRSHASAPAQQATEQPTVDAFWNSFGYSPRETDIVLPDASVFLSQEISGHSMSLASYIEHNYMKEYQDPTLSPERRKTLSVIFGSNLVTLGDFRAAQQILSLPATASFHLTDARFYSADAIKRNNVILIGGGRSNPWERLFDDQLNFYLGFDDEHSTGVIKNRHPQAGEQPEYAVPLDRNAPVGYGIIVYMQSPSGSGKVILVEGTSSDATNAAAEFLTSEKQLARLQETFHGKKLPYFEVLLKTSHLSGASFHSEVVAYRKLPESSS